MSRPPRLRGPYLVEVRTGRAWLPVAYSPRQGAAVRRAVAESRESGAWTRVTDAHGQAVYSVGRLGR